ncbi:hypothetical protein [Stenotrophomonas sp. MMGLT7]|uniref:hypothetical protein n=1 Tax=Stenotrophomonas sp. MMGLT7 TaxID=2901227 RepID=UPI001E5E8D99|nr:hypothetical protein [Stenotrophomonas sp. MMGLT7]MCD7096920.1 hypothetical protein [Stenotrophomonas sp. MMGLT7]
MINALRAIWAWFWKLLARFFSWLRKRGNGLKVLCAVLAFASAVAGLLAFEREQRVRSLGQQIVTIETECKTTTSQLQDAVAARDARLGEIAAALRAEAEKLKALQAENAAALEQLAGQIEAAEQDAATWRERYSQRPADCEAVLQLLDAACPALKGY